jgi:hypothetical protein
VDATKSHAIYRKQNLYRVCPFTFEDAFFTNTKFFRFSSLYEPTSSYTFTTLNPRTRYPLQPYSPQPPLHLLKQLYDTLLHVPYLIFTGPRQTLHHLASPPPKLPQSVSQALHILLPSPNTRLLQTKHEARSTKYQPPTIRFSLSTLTVFKNHTYDNG